MIMSIQKQIDAEKGIAERAIEDALQLLHDNTGIIPIRITIKALDIRTVETEVGDRSMKMVVTNITSEA
jgi:ribosomal protein S7